MKVLRGHSRMFAIAAGVAVAATGTAVLAIAGSAQAAERATCSETVNVRERPSLDAPVTDLCKAGTAVTVDKRQGNFVHLTSPQGWASADYVKTTSGTGQPSSASPTPQLPIEPKGPIQKKVPELAPTLLR